MTKLFNTVGHVWFPDSKFRKNKSKETKWLKSWGLGPPTFGEVWCSRSNIFFLAIFEVWCRKLNPSSVLTRNCLWTSIIKSGSVCALPVLSTRAISACCMEENKLDTVISKPTLSTNYWLKFYLSVRSTKPSYWCSLGRYF